MTKLVIIALFYTDLENDKVSYYCSVLHRNNSILYIYIYILTKVLFVPTCALVFKYTKIT